MSSLDINLWVLGVTCFLTWFLSIPTKDTSWVDRIWSVVPAVYAWVWASGASFTDVRLNAMAALITLWGARLTFNFARKGGYRSGGEDYRWEVLRKGMSPLQYQIFNIGFIVIAQNVILFLITTPMWALAQSGGSFDSVDAWLVVLFLVLLSIETIADQQQWNFHQFKKAEKAAGREVRPGFFTGGLFAFSRHPNFFAEVSQWWVVFLFSAVQVGITGYNWIGVVALTGLFIGSTRFTEQISASKYPDYEEYQKRVSSIIPWIPRGETERKTASN